MEQTILTVTQLNEYVRLLMESNPGLQHFYVRGEISNFKNHYSSGHLYFSLKDEGGLVRAVMFRGNASKIRFAPYDGMRVIVHARASLYTKDGQYQIYVEDMQPDGIGALYLAYEQLKNKLEAEGLFDPDRKKSLPLFPGIVGIITSETGAAVHDMMQIMERRYPLASVLLYPAAVQGVNAARELKSGIEWFNRKRCADVIIIGRGGGSFEDLFAFNDEALARAIAASAIPVVSAVGHETDFTICDFVADLRAPTPSAAAELVVPDKNDLFLSLQNASRVMKRAMNDYLARKQEYVRQLGLTPSLQKMTSVIELKRISLDSKQDALQSAAEHIIKTKRLETASLAGKIEVLSPLAVLKRGFSVVMKEDGKTVSDQRQVSSGETIHIRLNRGAVDATVK